MEEERVRRHEEEIKAPKKAGEALEQEVAKKPRSLLEIAREIEEDRARRREAEKKALEQRKEDQSLAIPAGGLKPSVLGATFAPPPKPSIRPSMHLPGTGPKAGPPLCTAAKGPPPRRSGTVVEFAPAAEEDMYLSAKRAPPTRPPGLVLPRSPPLRPTSPPLSSARPRFGSWGEELHDSSIPLCSKACPQRPPPDLPTKWQLSGGHPRDEYDEEEELDKESEIEDQWEVPRSPGERRSRSPRREPRGSSFEATEAARVQTQKVWHQRCPQRHRGFGGHSW